MRVTAAKSGLEQKAMRSGPNVWGRPKLCPEGCEQMNVGLAFRKSYETLSEFMCERRWNVLCSLPSRS